MFKLLLGLIIIVARLTIIKNNIILSIADLRHDCYSNYLTKNRPLCLWGGLWRKRLKVAFDVYTLQVSFSTNQNANQFSYFSGLKRREKYYFRLLKLKRAFRIFPIKRRVDLRRAPKIYHYFIRQFYLIRNYGLAFRCFKEIFKKPFSRSYIFYDELQKPTFRRAILRLYTKKVRLKSSWRYRKRKLFRPWKYYKLKRFKVKSRTKIVKFGSLRIKRFLRNSGHLQVAVRYSDLILRWRRLLIKKGVPPATLTISHYYSLAPDYDYFSPLKTNFLNDFGFYARIFNVFFKRKKNNFYLTLTNGFGEVLVHHSSGRFLKFNRNKKVRASLLNLPGLLTVFVKKLVRKKITSIRTLYRPAGVSKRALKTIYNIFNGSGVVIKTLVKNTKRSHGLLKRAKKIRRL